MLYMSNKARFLPGWQSRYSWSGYTGRLARNNEYLPWPVPGLPGWSISRSSDILYDPADRLITSIPMKIRTDQIITEKKMADM